MVHTMSEVSWDLQDVLGNINFIRWSWTLTDDATGTVILSGTMCTYYGCTDPNATMMLQQL